MASSIARRLSETRRSLAGEESEFAIELPRRVRDGSAAASRRLLAALRSHHRGASGARSPRGGEGALMPRPRPPQAQRCVIKASYSRKPTGWEPHAAYVEREDAQREGARGAGFDATHGAVDMRERARRWAEARDPHMFKFILSPEFGARVDLRAMTRALMAQAERDLDAKLEWAAIEHFNTRTPHVHVMLRGVNLAYDQPLRISKDYLSRGMRTRVQEWLTAQLGYRTEKDILAAREREVSAQKWTSLDRELERLEQKRGVILLATRSTDPMVRRRLDQLRRRARFLTERGLAVAGGNGWQLCAHARKALTTLDAANNRTAQLARSRSFLSDPGAPLLADAFKPGSVEAGRVLDFGLDEHTQRLFILIESVDGKVKFLHQPFKLERVAPLEQGRTYLFEVIEDVPAHPRKAGGAAPASSYSLRQTPYAEHDAALVDAWLERHDLQPPEFHPGKTYAAVFSQLARVRATALRAERGMEPLPVESQQAPPLAEPDRAIGRLV